jgi:hypothetical protein
MEFKKNAKKILKNVKQTRSYTTDHAEQVKRTITLLLQECNEEMRKLINMQSKLTDALESVDSKIDAPFIAESNIPVVENNIPAVKNDKPAVKNDRQQSAQEFIEELWGSDFNEEYFEKLWG